MQMNSVLREKIHLVHIHTEVINENVHMNKNLSASVFTSRSPIFELCEDLDVLNVKVINSSVTLKSRSKSPIFKLKRDFVVVHHHWWNEAYILDCSWKLSESSSKSPIFKLKRDFVFLHHHWRNEAYILDCSWKLSESSSVTLKSRSKCTHLQMEERFYCCTPSLKKRGRYVGLFLKIIRK